MKALFCHDGPTYIDNKGNYYACVLTDEIIDRYFYICNEFTLVNRLRMIENGRNYVPVNHKKTKIVEVPDITSINGIIKNRKKAKEIVEEEVKKCDFVIARLPGFIGAYGVKYARKWQKPYFIEMVGCPLDALWNHSLRGKMLAPFMYLYTKKILKDSQNTIYVTNEFLQKRYPSKGMQIGCSDVEIVIEKSVIEKRIKKINDMDKNIISLGTIGTLNMKYKGYDTVIKAISELNKKGNKKYYYKIIGAGNKSWIEYNINKYKMEKYVEIFEAVPHNQISEWLDKEVDIYIQPSRTEGMPRALIEAMSRACPAIGSNAGGIPELLDDKYIFRKNNWKQLSEKIVLLHQEEMKNQSNRNFNISEQYEKIKLEKIRKEFYDLFMIQNFKEKKSD